MTLEVRHLLSSGHCSLLGQLHCCRFFVSSSLLIVVGYFHVVFVNAGISGQPEGATPGQPMGNPGAWQGICSKGMPHTRGIRALLAKYPGAIPTVKAQRLTTTCRIKWLRKLKP